MLTFSNGARKRVSQILFASPFPDVLKISSNTPRKGEVDRHLSMPNKPRRVL